MVDGYKISPHYKDIPLDLTHFLLLRTREHNLLKNKLSAKLLNPRFYSSFTSSMS